MPYTLIPAQETCSRMFQPEDILSFASVLVQLIPIAILLQKSLSSHSGKMAFIK